ncbi:hypothetical protein F6O44_26455 (plasmid) [Klebsiella aerogenes]|nr:hypothetical protein F6O44_26455 [Klebsiella aerogenes]
MVSVLCESQLPRLDNLPGLTNLRKTTCQGGFFVYRPRDYDATERITSKSVRSHTDVKPIHPLHIITNDLKTQHNHMI